MTILLLIILVLVINPGHIWMPDMITMSLSVCLLVAFALFATFVFRARAHDEREHMHKLMVGHTAFLIGAGMLSISILYQSFHHEFDPWLSATLGAMILTKLIGIIWVGKKN